MNFKLTRLKVIVSLIIFIIVDLLLAYNLICLDGCPPWYFNVLEPVFLGISVIALLVVYVIWSLIEKK